MPKTAPTTGLIHPSFTCPYCRSPLIIDSKTWRCDGSLNDKHTQHPFDVARQGYVNLLPVQHKKTKDPGDSQDSIESRHRFLNQGYYQPLQQLIASIATKINDTVESLTWLDIGSGEGYYTEAIATALTHRSGQPINNLIAVDISKPAVIQQAKSAKLKNQLWYQIKSNDDQAPTAMNTTAINKEVITNGLTERPAALYPMVASAANLPMTDESVNAISTIFSPILPKEFARVLQTDGRLIIAKPDAGHLQRMRDALFDDVRPHDSDKFLDELAPYFELKKTLQVQCDLSLNAESVADLLTMTPYSYRAKAAKREALLTQAKTQDFNTKAKFVVYELVKK